VGGRNYKKKGKIKRDGGVPNAKDITELGGRGPSSGPKEVRDRETQQRRGGGKRRDTRTGFGGWGSGKRGKTAKRGEETLRDLSVGRGHTKKETRTTKKLGKL